MKRRVVAEVNSELLRQLTSLALACPAPTTLALATALATCGSGFAARYGDRLSVGFQSRASGGRRIGAADRGVAQCSPGGAATIRSADRLQSAGANRITRNRRAHACRGSDCRGTARGVNAPKLPVSVTCVQAPVFFGDSISLSLLASREIDLPEVLHVLDKALESSWSSRETIPPWSATRSARIWCTSAGCVRASTIRRTGFVDCV